MQSPIGKYGIDTAIAKDNINSLFKAYDIVFWVAYNVIFVICACDGCMISFVYISVLGDIKTFEFYIIENSGLRDVYKIESRNRGSNNNDNTADQDQDQDENGRNEIDKKAPIAISGDNIYVAWWTNETGNEVLFRTSTDAGQIFGDKINLSNTTNADSQDVEIEANDGNVLVTWWEHNATAEEPVVKISTDNGVTFGPLLELAANETIGVGG
jgi:hypothetical protein